jgi:hypothetical protein
MITQSARLRPKLLISLRSHPRGATKSLSRTPIQGQSQPLPNVLAGSRRTMNRQLSTPST